MLARAHARLMMAYAMIPRQDPSRAVGADCVDRRPPADTAPRRLTRLVGLG
jgi:hypothetical protein